MEREDIINKKFPHAFWGYDVTEVDLFLDEVIRELDRLHNELDMAEFTAEAARQREEKLKEMLASLTAGPAPYAAVADQAPQAEEKEPEEAAEEEPPQAEKTEPEEAAEEPAEAAEGENSEEGEPSKERE